MAATSTGVHIRLRPLRPSEASGAPPCAYPEAPDQLKFRAADAAETGFSFDAVHGSLSSQADVFAGVSGIVDSVMGGYNGTIMAYGQTGAGKTHTLIGDLVDAEQRGIVPRAISQLAQGIADSEATSVTVRLSVVEIYCERVRDLLGGSNADNLIIKQDAVRGIYIEGGVELEVDTEEQLLAGMTQGLAQRAASATAMNEASSRSHCIVTVTVEREMAGPGGTGGGTLVGGVVQRGKLVMVDLAGSERQDRSGTSGLALLEGSLINKSLSCLANVIGALTEERVRHVPYRDSKLTRVLQDSLGGTARTALIICCSPASENAAETLSSLRFGSRAKGVKNSVQANTRAVTSAAQQQQQLAALRAENERLRAELAAASRTAPSPPLVPSAGTGACDVAVTTAPDQADAAVACVPPAAAPPEAQQGPPAANASSSNATADATDVGAIAPAALGGVLGAASSPLLSAGVVSAAAGGGGGGRAGGRQVAAWAGPLVEVAALGVTLLSVMLYLAWEDGLARG